MKITPLLCILIGFYSNANSQFIFEKNNLPETVSILSYSAIVDVKHNEYSIEEIKKNTPRLKYKSLAGKYGNLGFTNHTYWVKFNLQNNLDVPIFYYLEAAESVTDHVNLYLFNAKGEVLIQKNGDKLDFEKRTVKNRKNIFEIKLLPKEKKQAFLELKNDGEKNSLPLNLISQESLLKKTYQDQLIMGIFYGILFIIAITYLFFYFAINELSFLYYSMYVLFVALCHFALDGFFHQYIATANSWINLLAVIIFAVLSSYFFGKYSEIILNVKQSSKLLTMTFEGLYLLFGLVLLGIIISPEFLKYSYPIVNILTLVGMLLIIVAISFLVINKKPIDLYYASGISILFICFTIVILINFGFIENTYSIENITKLGIGLEIIALSLSMANRIRLLNTKKEELQIIALHKSEEMNDMKSYFLSNMSHELRTPLNAILGISKVMETETTDLESKIKLENIRLATESLICSVNDIMDFSQIERGNLTLDNVSFSPYLIIKKLKTKFEEQAFLSGLNFKFTSNIQEDLFLSGDPVRLEQILTNILSNAVKYTAEGEIHFKIDHTIAELNKMNIQFMVEDTGIGISEQKLNSVFELFSQASINNKRKFGGFGIGLCVAKSLIDLQKGNIKLSSVLEIGTTCEINLTYEILPAEPKTILINSLVEYDLKNKHILIVEDNKMNQMVIKMMLKKWKNTHFSIANDGLECLEILKNNEIDVVLMDLQMPIMDGYEATTAIRNGQAGEGNSLIPIIIITADVLESTKNLVFELGVNDYMTKPVEAELLYEKIYNQVNKQEKLLVAV